MNEQTPQTVVSAPAGDFSISAVFSQAFDIYKSNLGQVYGLVFFPFLVSVVFSIVQGILPETLAPIISLISMLASIVVSIGVTRSFLQLIRQQEVTFSDNFKLDFGHVGSVIGGSILMGIVVGLGMICFILPGIYLALRYMFVPQLIIDKKVTVSEAFTLSTRMTEGIKMNLFLFGIAAMFVIVAGTLALLLGLIVAIPVVTVANYLLYTTLVSRVETN